MKIAQRDKSAIINAAEKCAMMTVIVTVAKFAMEDIAPIHVPVTATVKRGRVVLMAYVKTIARLSQIAVDVKIVSMMYVIIIVLKGKSVMMASVEILAPTMEIARKDRFVIMEYVRKLVQTIRIAEIVKAVFRACVNTNVPPSRFAKEVSARIPVKVMRTVLKGRSVTMGFVKMYV
ncbi:MAG: hypothetical protein JXA82_17625 [Sedimentisphaerales bacterium]|nr:hypothetical protein [Sedimentisphaerales bacterium]